MSWSLLPVLMASMLCFLLQYIMPFAACAAVQLALYEVYSATDDIITATSRRAVTVLYQAVMLFSISLLTVYVPLILFWAPQSYHRVKSLLVDIAKQQLAQCGPGLMHQPFSGVSFWYHDRWTDGSRQGFSRLIVALDSKEQSLFFTARQGVIQGSQLVLADGECLISINHDLCLEQFTSLELDLEQFVTAAQTIDADTTRFKPSNLLDSRKRAELIEGHKRIAQSLWQLLLPFLGFFSLFSWALHHRWGLIIALVSSGLWFIASYVTMLFAEGLVAMPMVALCIVYLPVITLGSMLIYRFLKR